MTSGQIRIAVSNSSLAD